MGPRLEGGKVEIRAGPGLPIVPTVVADARAGGAVPGNVAGEVPSEKFAGEIFVEPGRQRAFQRTMNPESCNF